MDIAVQIHSTPRALIADLLAVAASRTGSEAFIGTVQYATQREIQELLTAIGPALLEKRATKKELASTLLLKRGSFDHEKEIRLLWHVQGVAGRIVKYNIDPFKTVSKIVLDPTVDSKLEDEIRSMLALHVNGIPIEKSNLLDFGGFELPLPDV
ncbi:MAG TPA: hypothetical protein VG537_00460 [Candidatus Kapabacteria bacterium]|jgi:hypothetical protein|nr:hypothetical protein [Candidatus Kapabacteria bacterium]